MALNDNLVLSYPINGNANDVSGNGYDGVVTAATLTTDMFGDSNRAYSFDGSTAYITSPSTIASMTAVAGWTAMFWVYATTTSTRTRLCVSTNLITQYYGDTGNGGTDLVWFVGDGTTLSSAKTKTSFITFDARQHVCIKYDGITGTLYKNGVSVDTLSHSTGNTTQTSAFLWGGFSTINHLLGKMTRMRVYSRVLTDKEIKQIYNSQAGVFQAGKNISLGNLTEI